MLWRVRSRWQHLIRRSDAEREMDDEMAFHQEARMADLERRGVSREEARRRARIEFGGVEKYQLAVREKRRVTWLEDFVQDLRLAMRKLRNAPGFAAVAILTLALGTAANTTIFSWIRSVLLNPLPGAGEPGRVVAIESVTPSGDWVPTSYLDFRDVRDNTRLFESWSVTYPMALSVGDERHLERVRAELVSGSFFNLLRVRPEQGRFFTGAELEDTQNAHPVAVLSHAYWTSHFHSDPNAIGATLRVNQHLYTVIGVAPDGFRGSMPGLRYDVWALATMHGQLNSAGEWMLRDRKTRMFRVLARLAPGVTFEQAREEVQALGKRMAVANADTSAGMGLNVLTVRDSHYGVQQSLSGPLAILMGAAGVLLLIVCANITNLLLARATGRRKEFTVRLALGAPRSRLVRQLLTESLLLASLGALAGLALTMQLSGALQYLFPAARRGLVAPPPIDMSVLLFTLALTMGVAVVAGLAPALQAARGEINETLKETGRTGASGRSSRLRGALVISEIALAAVAVIGAGLFVKSFRMTRTIYPGFDAQQVAVANFSMYSAGYSREQADSFCQRLREKLEREPGVTAVSYADYMPLGLNMDSWEDLQVVGYVPGPSENMKVFRSMVSPGYFSSLKIPMLLGRDFTLQDDRGHEPVMIVNETFVRRFLRGGYPLGAKVQGWGQWFTIVGVVADSKSHRLTEASEPYFYIPIREIYRPEMTFTFFIRMDGPVNDALAAIRRDAQSTDPASLPFDVTSLEDVVAQSLFTNKISADLLSILAGASILLAAIGLYGVMAYAVAQRTSEIGIRVTLGARPGQILKAVLGQGLRMAGFGLGAGWLAAMVLARFGSGALVNVSAVDPVIYGAGAIFVLTISALATAIPGWRAMRVDPTVALRYE